MKEVNIETHIYTPKHSKITEKEAKELISKYNISLKQLPKISSKDPLAKKLEVEAGDIIKIVRNSETTGKSVFYRLVI